MNQGIIKHAQNAVDNYNEAQNNETEYLTYAEGEMDKYAGASGSSTGGDSYTPPAEDVDALKKYFMGTKEDGSINEEGQSLTTHTSDGVTFDDDEMTIGSGSNVSMFMYRYATVQEGTQFYYYYIKYKNQDAYRLTIDISSYSVKDVVFVYRPQGAEGETRTYKGEQWTVLYDKGTTMELVSPKTIGTVTLGERGNLEKSIADYNNAVNILNKYCRDNLNEQSARSVGSNWTNPESDNPGMYTSSNLANWAGGTYNGVGKKTDDNAEQDFVRMVYHGVNVAKDAEGNNMGYWLASRCVYDFSDTVYFSLGAVNSQGSNDNNNILWYVNSNGSGTADDIATLGVRACVTVAK